MNGDELLARIKAFAERGWSLRLRKDDVRALAAMVARRRRDADCLSVEVRRRIIAASRHGRGVRMSVDEVRAAARAAGGQ